MTSSTQRAITSFREATLAEIRSASSIENTVSICGEFEVDPERMRADVTSAGENFPPMTFGAKAVSRLRDDWRSA